MLKKKLEAKASSSPAPKELEVTQTLQVVLKHLFLNIDFSKLNQLSRIQQLKRKIEVTSKEINAVKRLLETIHEAVIIGAATGTRIELEPTNSSFALVENINEYIPLDSPNTSPATLELLDTTISQNSVYWLIKKGERINRPIKISIVALVNYLIQKYNLPPATISIPALAYKNTDVFILGTTKNSVPQSLIFFIDGAPRGRRAIQKTRHQRLSPNTSLLPI